MTKVQLAKFKKLLEEKRREIVRKAELTLEQDMTLDVDDLPDEMDLASSEYLQAFTFRLRGREKAFLDKIQKALDRIGNEARAPFLRRYRPVARMRLKTFGFQAGHHLVHLLPAAGVDDHPGPVGCQLLSDGPAQVAGGAGDHGNPSFGAHIGFMPPKGAPWLPLGAPLG